MPIRKEEINIYIALLSLFCWIQNRDKSYYQEYILCFIKKVNPKIILSSNFYDVFILNLKKNLPNTTLIFFQHTSITKETFYNIINKSNKFNKLDPRKKKYLIDYIFCVGKTSVINLKKIIKGNFYISGSLNNNYFYKKKKFDKKSIIFISQFPLEKRVNIQNFNNKFKYLNSEKIFFQNVLDFCNKKKIKLKVIPKTYDKIGDEAYKNILNLNSNFKKEDFINLERKFYDFLIGKNNYTFIKRTLPTSSYINAQKYLFFLCYNSSLGVELLSTGKRVAFFPMKKVDEHIYGWKYSNKKHKEHFNFWEKRKKGLIWSHSQNKKEVFRVLKNITSNKKIGNLKNTIVDFSINNTVFKNFFLKKYKISL